jgi:hypothetical protein
MPKNESWKNALSCATVKVVLVFGGVEHYVEDVVTAKQHVAVVRERLVILGFSCSLKKYVHVSIALYHFSLVFAAVFEDDFDVSVKLFDEYV